MHGHTVGVVSDYVDTVSAKSMTVQTLTRLRWRFQKTLKASYRFSRNSQVKKRYLGVYKPSSNNLKIWKFSYLKKNLGVGIVVDYADMQFSNFVSEYLWENKKVRETVFACSNGTQIESFKPKKWSKISCHCPFKHASFFYLWESVQQNCCNISTKGVPVQVSTIVGHRYF